MQVARRTQSGHKKIELTHAGSARFLNQCTRLPGGQLGLRSRSGFFLRRRRNFLHSRSSGGRSGATAAARRSRAARGLGGAAGRGWLAAAHCLNLARSRGRSTGRRARSRSGLSTAGRLLSLAALDLRSLAALDLRGLAAVLGFSGTAESSQDGQGRAQRNQLHRTTHDVSLSLHYDGGLLASHRGERAKPSWPCRSRRFASDTPWTLGVTQS